MLCLDLLYQNYPFAFFALVHNLKVVFSEPLHTTITNRISKHISKFFCNITPPYWRYSSIDRWRRHLFSDITKMNVDSVIHWLDFVKRRCSGSCVRPTFTRSHLHFSTSNSYHPHRIGKTVHFLFRISNGIIPFDFF